MPYSAPLRIVPLVCVLLSTYGCGESPPASDYTPSASDRGPPPPRHFYRFGVRPIRNTKLLWETYAPLVREVNSRLSSFGIRLESGMTEPAFDTKLRRGELDAALVEPHRVIDLEPCGYRVFARAGDRDRIGGVVVAQKELGIRHPRDLRGKVICFSSPGALASTMLVKVYLKKSGLDVERQATLRYTGSSDSSLLNLLAGDAAAAGVSRAVWERFTATETDSASSLQLLWRTEELPGFALMAHSRMAAEHVAELRQAFLALAKSEQGVKALSAARLNSFQAGESGSYDSLWEFLHEYKSLFKQLPEIGGRR